MKEELQKERRSHNSPSRKNDHRDDFERDLARLIHSAAFRRLQAKTQVLGIGEGDFHRTRLTHSLEVAQVGRGILKHIENLKPFSGSAIQQEIKEALPTSDLISFAGLAHDLGHPPFGHGGEIALNYSMRDHGGFEGNGQTLRILSKLEAHTLDFGLDLTRRSLLSILKYPVNYSCLRRLKLPDETKNLKTKASDWKPPKCYHDDEKDVMEWILRPIDSEDREHFTSFHSPTEEKNGKSKEESLDTTIMELADDIAYGVHDLEDAIALRLITREKWLETQDKFDSHWVNERELQDIENQLFGESWQRKRAIGAIVHAFIVSSKIILSNPISYHSPLLNFRVELCGSSRDALDALRNLIKEEVINAPEVQTLEYRGQQIVMQMFEAIASDPSRLLNSNFRNLWKKAPDEQKKMRVICDYISGMTDEYATRIYERLFMPRQGTVFQRL